MNALNRFVLSLVAGAVIVLCVGGAFIALTAINSPHTWTQAFADPRTAAEMTRMAAAGFILFQALMGIVFAGSLSVLLSIEKAISQRGSITPGEAVG